MNKQLDLLKKTGVRTRTRNLLFGKSQVIDHGWVIFAKMFIWMYFLSVLLKLTDDVVEIF